MSFIDFGSWLPHNTPDLLEQFWNLLKTGDTSGNPAPMNPNDVPVLGSLFPTGTPKSHAAAPPAVLSDQQVQSIVAQWALLDPTQQQQVLAGLNPASRDKLNAALSKSGFNVNLGASATSPGGGAGTGGGTAGTTTTTGGPAEYTTPDGHVLVQGSADEIYYNAVNQIWTQTFLQPAPWSVVQAFKAQGIKTAAQMSDVLNGMPSGIPGVNLGTYDHMLSTAQKYGDKYFGRSVPGSLIKELARDGKTTPTDIQTWFEQHSLADMPKEDYAAIFDLANNWTQKHFGDVPHPDQIAAIAKAASGPGPFVPPNTGAPHAQYDVEPQKGGGKGPYRL